MFNKIRYRLVYNYASKLNKEGKAPVALECRQGKKKMYISSGVLLSSNQWGKGQVINHDNANLFSQDESVAKQSKKIFKQKTGDLQLQI